jgi:hypothetical protein
MDYENYGEAKHRTKKDKKVYKKGFKRRFRSVNIIK